MTINSGVLKNILYNDEYILDRIVDHSRWSVLREMIFKFGDKVYIAEYSIGATELQDERPWEGLDEVECYEAEEVLEKTWKIKN